MFKPKESDWLRLSCAVLKIYWASNPHSPCGHYARGNLHFFLYTTSILQQFIRFLSRNLYGPFIGLFICFCCFLIVLTLNFRFVIIFISRKIIVYLLPIFWILAVKLKTEVRNLILFQTDVFTIRRHDAL